MMVETEKAISVGSEETEWLPMAVEGHVTRETDMQEQGPALPHLRTLGLIKVSRGICRIHQGSPGTRCEGALSPRSLYAGLCTHHW